MDQYQDALDERMVGADPPTSMRGLRACIPCMLIKNFDQYYQDGCENCPFLDLKENRERCETATTANFDGLVSLMSPAESWVARWQRVDKLVPGCYAVKVNAEVSPEVEDLLRELNVRNLGKLSQEEH